MLYPAKINNELVGDFRRTLADMIGEINMPERHKELPKELEPGVWQFAMWNPEFYFQEKLHELNRYHYPDRKGPPVNTSTEPEWMDGHFYGGFGVCDGPDQLLRDFPQLRTDERQFVVTLVQLLKSEQESPGGWRWHKWGCYIGDQNPQCEYLADEPVITEAWTFHIYEILPEEA